MKVLLTTPPMIYLLLELGVEGGLKGANAVGMSVEHFREQFSPPLAIYVLAAILREHEYSVDIMDPLLHQIKFSDTNKIGMMVNSDQELKKLFSKIYLNNLDEMQFPDLEKRIKEVDVIGISAASFEWFLARTMIKRIKDCDPEMPTIIGGIHATFADKHILETSKVDYVVRREGEKTLPELLDAIRGAKNIKDVRGITYRDKEKRKIIRNEDPPPLTVSEMEATPLPAFDLLPSNVYSMIGVETSRGCKFSCVFCSIPFRKFWRGLSPRIVQKRIEHALDYTEKLYNKKKICLVDDTFSTDIKRAKQIFLNLSETDFNGANLCIEARINDFLDSNMIELCKNIPFEEIQVGVESGYEEGLKNIKKGLSIDKVEKFASLIKRHGLSDHIHYGFIVGFPGETREDCLRTIDFAYHLISKYGGLAYISFFQLLPGSSLWINKVYYGIKEGLEVFDGLFWKSKEFRFEISKIGEEDIDKIINQIDKYQFLLLLKKGYGIINRGYPYLEVIK